MSLNIITVTLNMGKNPKLLAAVVQSHFIALQLVWHDCPLTEKYNFLGISIVGQSNERGDGGIYIGSIMKGGAVAADGRIEPGDMLLQVRDLLEQLWQMLILPTCSTTVIFIYLGERH